MDEKIYGKLEENPKKIKHHIIVQDSWITSQSTITLKKFRDIGIEDGWKYVPTVGELGPPYFQTVEIPEKNILLSIVTDTTLYAKHNNLEYKRQPLIKRKFKFLGKGRKVEEMGKLKDDKDKVRWKMVNEKREMRRKVTWQVVHGRQPKKKKKQDEEPEAELEEEQDEAEDEAQAKDNKGDNHELQDMLLETSEEETPSEESDPDPLDRTLSDSDNPSMTVSSDEYDPLDPISFYDTNRTLCYQNGSGPEEKESYLDEEQGSYLDEEQENYQAEAREENYQDEKEENNNKEFIDDHVLYGMILESSDEESVPRHSIRSFSDDSDAPSMTVSDDEYDPLEPEIILEEVLPHEPRPEESPGKEDKISVLQEKIAQLRNKINANMNQYFK